MASFDEVKTKMLEFIEIGLLNNSFDCEDIKNVSEGLKSICISQAISEQGAIPEGELEEEYQAFAGEDNIVGFCD